MIDIAERHQYSLLDSSVLFLCVIVQEGTMISLVKAGIQATALRLCAKPF